MAHALVTQVDLTGYPIADSERMLREQVVPSVTQLAGFQRGVWLRSADDRTGTGIVVFDTESDAIAARDGMSAIRPADAPPITSAAIHLVTGLA